MEMAKALHVPSYGNNCWTEEAADAIRELFQTPCDVFFVFKETNRFEFFGPGLTLPELPQPDLS